MFSDDLRGVALGTGIFLSAIGLSPNLAEAGAPVPEPPATPAAVLDTRSAETLNQSTHIDRLTGPLQHAKPPVYDGPVSWGGSSMVVPAAVLGATVGVIIPGGIGLLATDDVKKGLAAAAIGGLALGVGGASLAHHPAETIIFETRIQSIENTFDPIGKTVNSFSQHLRIPETDLILFVEGVDAPFVEGQKITAHFYLNKEGNIVGWSAGLAKRDQAPLP